METFHQTEFRWLAFVGKVFDPKIVLRLVNSYLGALEMFGCSLLETLSY